MMAVAQHRAEKMGLHNVLFRQGDVGALPFENSSFDLILSLNGLLYESVELETVESMACFTCRKGE